MELRASSIVQIGALKSRLPAPYIVWFVMLIFLLSGTGLLGQAAATFSGQDVTAERIEQADKEPQNWLTFFGNYGAWSYSSLDQITRENVKHLVPVWAFPTGGNGLEAAPIVADGVLYLEDPENDVFAIDASTGSLLWKKKYDYAAGTRALIHRARGVAIGYGMVFLGTNDDHLAALNAKTGKEVWNVTVEDASKCGCLIASPPLVVKNMVIAGGNGGDAAHRGYLSAFDAKTGKLIWRFYSIPAPGEPGSETWTGDSWKFGGGSMWYQGSYDPELNLIYWGVSNPSSDYYGEDRKGVNLYTDSLVAIDASTGKLKWYFQETPHDLYDYHSSLEPALIDVQENNKKRKLVLHSSKNGFAYVLDRENGAYLSSFPYVEALTWTKGLDKEGKPIDAVVPELGKDYLFCPGALGGHNRNHSAYSPRIGWWYSTSLEMCSKIKPAREIVEEGDHYTGGDFDRELSPTSTPFIGAFDPLTGKRKWTFRTKYMNVSSLLATAGDLVFGGDVEGYAFALDARTGEKVWSFSTGGRVASPPVSFSVNGRQYIAIASGGGSRSEISVPMLWPASRSSFPQNASTLFVFALSNAN
jgi:alcohol dehydrogenase (cytochrome c)